MDTPVKHAATEPHKYRSDDELLAELAGIGIARRGVQDRCQLELDRLSARCREIKRALDWPEGCVQRPARRAS